MMLNPTVTPTWVRGCDMAHQNSKVQVMRRVSLMQQSSAVRAEYAGIKNVRAWSWELCSHVILNERVLSA